MSEQFKISELANLFGITSDTLRFYEKKGLLKPAVNEHNGYRSYELGDINLLIDILFYRHLDLSVQDIHDILYQSDLDGLDALLAEKRQMVQRSIDHQKLLLKKLAMTQRQVYDIRHSLNVVTFRKMPQFYILLRGRNELSAYRKSQKIFSSDIFDACQLVGVYEKQGAVLNKSAFMVLLERSVEDEFHLLEGKACELLDEPHDCAYTLLRLDEHRDVHEQLKPILAQIKQAHRTCGGKIYVNYLFAVSESDANEFYTELYIPLES